MDKMGSPEKGSELPKETSGRSPDCAALLLHHVPFSHTLIFLQILVFLWVSYYCKHYTNDTVILSIFSVKARLSPWRLWGPGGCSQSRDAVAESGGPRAAVLAALWRVSSVRFLLALAPGSVLLLRWLCCLSSPGIVPEHP